MEPSYSPNTDPSLWLGFTGDTHQVSKAPVYHVLASLLVYSWRLLPSFLITVLALSRAGIRHSSQNGQTINITLRCLLGHWR